METPEEISSRVPPSNFASGNVFLFGFGVPDGGFQAGLGHVVAADVREHIENFGGGIEFLVLAPEARENRAGCARRFPRSRSE